MPVLPCDRRGGATSQRNPASTSRRVLHLRSWENGKNNYTCAEYSSQGHQGQVAPFLPASEMRPPLDALAAAPDDGLPSVASLFRCVLLGKKLPTSVQKRGLEQSCWGENLRLVRSGARSPAF